MPGSHDPGPQAADAFDLTGDHIADLEITARELDVFAFGLGTAPAQSDRFPTRFRRACLSKSPNQVSG